MLFQTRPNQRQFLQENQDETLVCIQKTAPTAHLLCVSLISNIVSIYLFLKYLILLGLDPCLSGYGLQFVILYNQQERVSLSCASFGSWLLLHVIRVSVVFDQQLAESGAPPNCRITTKTGHFWCTVALFLPDHNITQRDLSNKCHNLWFFRRKFHFPYSSERPQAQQKRNDRMRGNENRRHKN